MRPVTKIGDKFGRWVVIRPSKFDGKVTWTKVRCKCGIEREVRTCSLRRGVSKSCGCLEKELNKKRNTTHGQRYTRLYRIWLLMKNRCHNSNASNWKWYGDKGIKVCKEWQTFENFYAWAIINGYQDHLTIDRIRGSVNYQPSNCRWVTDHFQKSRKKSKR